MPQRVITDESELATTAEEILSILPQKTVAHVIGLTGELGVGKTAFVKAIARQLGITEHITSPTFVIMKMYDVAGHEQFRELIHIDAYRIEDIEEMRVLRLDELYQKEGTLICIEWPERISEVVPKDTLHIEIEMDTEGVRTFTYGEEN